jgi:hypothetical protein
MGTALYETRRTSRLPEGWSEPAVVEDVVIVDDVKLYRAGLSSVAPDGEEITSSAAEPTGSPLGRSYFELLERVSTFEALRSRRLFYELWTSERQLAGFLPASEVFPESDEPNRWRYARSNGVALHASFSGACQRALWELAERDRVLRSWYGEIVPRRLPLEAAKSPLAAARSYDFRAYAFPDPGTVWSRGVHVAGIFGFPRRAEAPLVYGYAGRDDLGAALEAAQREAMQLLAFLWGEPIPDGPAGAAPTPLHHLERFLWPKNHELLRRWLDGRHAKLAKRTTPTRTDRSACEAFFVDLTPAWLGGGLSVAKAVAAPAAPLAFGDAPFASHLPQELRLHPIA